MNDINVCRLRFFVAEGPGGAKDALAGRVWGLLVVGGMLAAAHCASKREREKEIGADRGLARDGAAVAVLR
jgi:hypothetical protein